NDCANYNITMPIQVLRRRVKYQVSPERQRLLPRRRKECVVNDDECSTGTPELCELLDIGNAQQRIARRLDPQQVGRLGERGANSSLIRKVDELDLSFATTTPRIEQPVSSTVAIVGSNDPSIAGNQVSHQRDSCHARCGHNTTRTQFQLGNSRSEQIPRRISGACVVVAPLFPKTAERKRRGEVNGG